MRHRRLHAYPLHAPPNATLMVTGVLHGNVMVDATQADETRAANVSERKFNGTATLVVTATDERTAEFAARRYFRETHGSDPSKVIAQEDEHAFTDDGETRFEVMVADHSSGSLADSAQYDFGGDGA